MSQWATQLGPLLMGQTQAAYHTLICTEALDYQPVKEAILYQLEISLEHYQQQF